MAPALGKLLEALDKRFETEELDEFRDLVAVSLNRQQTSLASVYASLSDAQFDDPNDRESYAVHLEDRMVFANEVQKLADELAIVALFKKVELHTKRVAKRNFPKLDEGQLFNIASLIKVMPFDVEALPNFKSFHELRLLSNAIKHEGKVSHKLAGAFPSWKVGESLADLGAVYARLNPEVTEYVQAFVAACYAHSHKFKA